MKKLVCTLVLVVAIAVSFTPAIVEPAEEQASYRPSQQEFAKLVSLIKARGMSTREGLPGLGLGVGERHRQGAVFSFSLRGRAVSLRMEEWRLETSGEFLVTAWNFVIDSHLAPPFMSKEENIYRYQSVVPLTRGRPTFRFPTGDDAVKYAELWRVANELGASSSPAGTESSGSNR